jgi:hypothetical protein
MDLDNCNHVGLEIGQVEQTDNNILSFLGGEFDNEMRQFYIVHFFVCSHLGQ